MSNNALLNGVTTQVRPSAIILTELFRKGWTQEDIDLALSDKPWVPLPPLETETAEMKREG